MPLTLRWEDIALRLVLTVIAGSLIGINRSEGGHSAGLRTTLLVCLAASVAMIQTNLLLPMTGKTPESFAVLDLMRLPLGILTGMGFIGGGAILRKGEMVQGSPPPRPSGWSPSSAFASAEGRSDWAWRLRRWLSSCSASSSGSK